MIFSDLWFLVFIVASVPAIWLLPEQLRRVGLLAVCMVFHGHYAGSAGVAPIVVLSVVVYLALRSSRAHRIAAIALCVGSLLYYKYTGYFNSLTGLSLPVVAAPLAISFFVFEFVHLMTDQNQSKLKGRILPLDFAVFTIFFPALASGPIKRYQQFKRELPRLGKPETALLAQSCVRILLGYFKKFCIADALARDLPTADGLPLWQGGILALSLLQGIRIYMDFSGYSDIAIGMAGLLNIRLPENFSFPYLATNISEFWRRWHISLSTWIRDYVYIILGGSRVSQFRRSANLMAAMVLCGLWHGSATHFIVWGLLHGTALLVVHLWKGYSPIQLHSAVAWACTFGFVQLSWLVFFYDLQSIWALFQRSRLL